ncbi:MAG: hypothetical protein JWO35_549 [Candidatus Saccharibacteria bacterium]|nr:hypothetical protein [Candidatus Saccharibacteria bacterium]
MSEQAPTLEKGPDFSKLKNEKLLPTAEQAEKLRPGEKDPMQALAEARVDVAETAQESAPVIEDLKAASEQAAPAVQPKQINRELKNITLKRELNQIQRKLPAPKRALSKIVHQPVIRAVSETAGKTVSRPSGLLGGGLVAFLGTSGYLYLAKHLGFEYNSFVFVALFAGGFVVGLVLELLVHLATAGHRKNAD